jgi:Rps23 Pro-64 3,4-dihydroxylase Tpa1-like proline 4-hydroxylase
MIDDALRRHTKWSLAYNRKDRYLIMSQEEFGALGQAGAQKFMAECIEAARTDYQYLYACYPIVDAILNKRDQGHLLHTVLQEMNSPYFIEFIRAVTGIESITKADGQATLYRSGHFLKLHDDLDERRDRRVAYVLGFTKNWQADWGGVLQFYDEAGNVECGLLPRYNSLSLFTVPREHAVTFVAPFATEGRYSITGWFSDR